jgi:hypothetical protein
MCEPLLIAQLDAAQIQHAILHRHIDLLAAAGGVTMMQRAHDAQRKMQPGAGIADLGAGDQRRTIVKACGGRSTAGTLRDVLVNLAIGIGAWSEAFDGREDHPRIQRLNALPREAHPIQRTRGKILHHHVAGFYQFFQHVLTVRIAPIDGDRALVMIQHRKIQAVDIGDITQLTAGDVTHARPFHLNYVSAKPREQLRAGRPRLNMGKIENSDTIQSFRHVMLLLSSTRRFSG